MLTLDVIDGRPAVLIEGHQGERWYWFTLPAPGVVRLERVDHEGSYTQTLAGSRWWCDCPHFRCRCDEPDSQCKHGRTARELVALFGVKEVVTA